MKAMIDSVFEHEIGPTGLLAIRLHASDLRVRAVDGSTVRISDPSGTMERSLLIERAPGSLALRADRGISIGIGSLGLDVGRRTPDLDVEVPRGATVVLETASGDITIDGLTGDQRYRTASGSILLREVGGRLTVDAVSGDVSIGADRDCTLTARTVSGDLTLRAGTVGGLRMSTTSGDMRIEGRLAGDGPFAIESVSGDTILAPVGGVSVTVKSVTGDIRSDVPSATDGSRGSRTVTVGGGGAHLTLRSISGDLRLVPPSGRAIEVPPPAPTIAIAPSVPEPPSPPMAPEAPTIAIAATTEPAAATERVPEPAVDADQSLAVLEALERGEIDVAEASRRLAELDAEARS
jgi:hypothetical protein